MAGLNKLCHSVGVGDKPSLNQNRGYVRILKHHKLGFHTIFLQRRDATQMRHRVLFDIQPWRPVMPTTAYLTDAGEHSILHVRYVYARLSIAACTR